MLKIKRYSLKNGVEVIGALTKNKEMLVSIDGKVYNVNNGTQIVDEKSTRVPSNIREALENTCEEYDNLASLLLQQKEISQKIFQANNNVKDKLKAINETFCSVKGIPSTENVRRIVTLGLGKTDKKFTLPFEYTNVEIPRVELMSDEFIVDIYNTVYIEKYARADKYPFMYQEYDDAWFVDSDSKEYESLVKKYSSCDFLNDYIAAVKKKGVTCESDQNGLGIGDKRFLYYWHGVTLRIPITKLKKI